MHKQARLVIAVLLIGGCTNAVGTDPAPLGLELAAKRIGPAQSCVPVSASEDLAVMPDGTLGVRSGKTLWINDTGKACKNIRAMSTLIVERHGSEICRGDHVRSVELSGGIPGPVCILGDFVPYREE
jgi:hypothetical protein